MLRKTLTILSLIGLLLSVGAWGVSYWGISYATPKFQGIQLCAGTFNCYDQRFLSATGYIYHPPWRFSRKREPATLATFSSMVPWRLWGIEYYWHLGASYPTMQIPLWMPTFLFALPCFAFLYLPARRRRKRKKLGLCVKCGYNLKGLTEPRCPECGTSFGEVMMFSRRRVFIPRFSGELEFRALPDDFVATLESRIQEGFLVRGNHARSNYRICSSSTDSVTISADDWWTAINVGLNEVRLRREGDQRITFEVSFWRWTGYAAMLGMLFFATLLGIYGFTDWMKPWLPPNRLETLGSLSIGIFFCLCWPWILTEFQKKPAARCLERILHETFTDAA